MSYIESISQVTEVSYQTIESNLIWEIKNRVDLNSRITSKIVKIPLINGEW